MDTFFFVYVDLADSNQLLRFGPYATLGAAAEIMMDCLPGLLVAETHLTDVPKYKASISEWMINDGAWEKLKTTAIEDTRD